MKQKCQNQMGVHNIKFGYAIDHQRNWCHTLELLKEVHSFVFAKEAQQKLKAKVKMLSPFIKEI